MNRFAVWYQTSIGAKMVMAATGALLFLFVIGHLLGNLLIFAGRDAVNAYAHKLRELGVLLWVIRLGLLAVFLLHIASAFRVSMLNRSARPVAYVVSTPVASTYASRTILMSGLIVLAFVVYHLLHFTLGVTNPEYLRLRDALGRLDVYTMVIRGFSHVLVAGAYVVAMFLLAMHLSHGVTSMFQTFGLNHPRYNGWIKRLGPFSAVVIFAGYVSIPAAVLSGLLRLP